MTARVRIAMREQRGEAGDGYAALSYVLAGPLLYGGLGWVGDHFLGTVFLTLVGVVIGLALSVYVLYKRFGAPPVATDTTH
jgi:F0F1-type ATP synthase assembly protein I